MKKKLYLLTAVFLLVAAGVYAGLRYSGYIHYSGKVDCNETECFIPEGPFKMGCNDELDKKCKSYENPYHQVVLKPYAIDKYEVTADGYRKCVDAGVCTNNNESEPQYKTTSDDSHCNLNAAGKGDHPMNCVSWYGAKTYCEWLGKRLPTEAEWEKAARGDSGRLYPWGNEEASCKHTVMAGGPKTCIAGATMSVGLKKEGVSPYGVYDMAGNVYEWVNDWYASDYYSSSPGNDPEGPSGGISRVLRGGSWECIAPDLLRTSARISVTPDSFSYGYGFRCAK